MQKRYRDTGILYKVGNRIRAIREDKNLTQEQLANLCNLPTSQIGRIERGELNTGISHLALIAEHLKVHPKELWEFEL